MKRVSLFLLCAVSVLATAGGHWVGNGGDSMALAILQRTRELANMLGDMNPECRANLDLSPERFKEILSSLTVETTREPLYVEEMGHKVYKEAINIPAEVHIVVNRDDYPKSGNKDQLLIHEILSLAQIVDDRGKESQLTTLSLKNKSCFASAEVVSSSASERVVSAEFEPGEIPIFSEMDSKGVLYFLISGRNRILRYSLPTAEFLPPLETEQEPQTLAVSSQLGRVYVAYPSKKLTYFDLKYPGKENFFANAELTPDSTVQINEIRRFQQVPIAGLLAMGNTLVVVPREFQQWLTLLFLNPSGKVSGQSGWVDPMVAMAADSGGRGFYFISDWRPRTLHFYPLKAGLMGRVQTIENQDEFGRHELNGPLVVSPIGLATGSGNLYSADKMQFIRNIGESFDQGVWVGNELYIGRSVKQGFVIKAFRAPEYMATFEQSEPLGALIALHAWGGKPVRVWLNSENRVKIEYVNK